MTESPLQVHVIGHVGPATLTEPVVTTWALVAVAGLGAWLLTRRPRTGKVQAVLEVSVSAVAGQIQEVIGADPGPYLPLLGTLFFFLATANLSGIVPGLRAPTASLETTAALATVVFFSVHYYGIRIRGLKRYLKSFLEPSAIMLPINILAQVTRTFSLMIRLFGNVMSGEFVIALLLALAGLLVPLPLMALEMLTGLVQAYIFTVLAAVFVGAAVGSIEGG
jgi:F-type H+-transporting ATPase subunit a